MWPRCGPSAAQPPLRYGWPCPPRGFRITLLGCCGSPTYTTIPTNLLFFDKGGPTKEIWFYEVPPPEGRKKYTKTKPIRFAELAACQQWWVKRTENERAWRVLASDAAGNDYNLDLRNPNRPDDLAHRPPRNLLAELVETEREILAQLENLEGEIA